MDLRQDFKASAQLSGVQDLSAMELLLGTLLGGRAKAAYESVSRNTDECSTGSGKRFPKWEGPYTITKRRGQVYTIRRGDKQKRVNASQLQRWVQWDKPISNNPQLGDVAPRRSERLRTKLFDVGTSVVRAGC
uniref:Uncharacterized protein n=1 Tax=Trichobilharzia regenti TaxID=157069 RepID=A0AA85KHN5_TRIRE|nr:unnamed protein product [Trichobilharzia regenti]